MSLHVGDHIAPSLGRISIDVADLSSGERLVHVGFEQHPQGGATHWFGSPAEAEQFASALLQAASSARQSRG